VHFIKSASESTATVGKRAIAVGVYVVELGCWGACVEHFIDFTDENYKRKSMLAKHNPFWYTVKIGAFNPNRINFGWS
jgi:hypothetical protein